MSAVTTFDAQQRIRDQIALVKSHHLDQPVLTRTGVPGLAIGAVLDFSGGRSEVRDVAITSIIGLNRNDILEPEDTWRTAMNSRLCDPRWPKEILSYFETPILAKDFPALGMGYPLRLECIEGAYFCANGNHRLIAAIAWLISQHGDEAILQKVQCTIQSVHREVFTWLLNEYRSQKTISIAKSSAFDGTLVRIDHKLKTSIYHCYEGDIALIHSHRFMGLRRWFQFNELPWQPFPEVLIKTWLRAA